MTDSILLTATNMSPLSITTADDGVKTVCFQGQAGLYQFSLFLDAARFDWESLYQTLNVHHNENERTGPWDFDLMTARPLIPSYWIYLDGKKLGLWYVQRVSLEDLANKRFRGRFAFDLRADGMHELVLKPFRPMHVTWLSARLEHDPEDQLRSGLTPAHSAAALQAAQWALPSYWELQRKKLETTHAHYQKPLQALFKRVREAQDGQKDGIAIPFLVAAYHLDGQKAALERALALVDEAVAMPAWGRPDEELYGHNGDIGGAGMLRNMALVYHMLGPELGVDRRERLLRKLTFQGEAFLVQMLLMRDYWGGSRVQDHGWRAAPDFGTAAICLWGVVPEADRWVSYIVPRIEHGLDAAPVDGVIPGSSYYALHLYTDNLMWYREALLARTGVDLAGHPALAGIPAFMATVLNEREHALLMVECDRAPLLGGGLFMETMAAKNMDPVAARLSRALLATPEVDLGLSPYTTAAGILFGFLAHDPATAALVAPPRPRRELRLFEDSGFVHYRDDDTGVALSVKCGPWLGYNTQRRATGPCDMMECLPGAGHFSVFVGGVPVLVSPDIGYKLRSAVRSCMLVDDAGQIGDVGYPMSIPSQPHRGDRVEEVRWNPEAGTGSIRLDLKRAYPPESGVRHYTREFIVSTNREIICRDCVVLDKPRKLSWLFQFREDAGGVADGQVVKIGKGPVLQVEPRSVNLALATSVHPTKVVYSYSSSFKRYQHARYDTKSDVSSVNVDFVLSW
ncbi:MAG: hypothetical protein WCL16_00220 [bacterium]